MLKNKPELWKPDAENYKMLLREIKELSGCSIYHAHGWADSILVMLPKLIYRFSVIYQNLSRLFSLVEIDRLMLKCIWKCKGPRIARTVWKKNKIGRLTHPSLFQNFYCKATVIQKVWYWYKDRCMDQWCRRKSPEINPNICGRLMFIRGAKGIRKR